MPLAAIVASAASATVAEAQPVALGPPSVIDGPSAAIGPLGGVAVARDGTGAVVYLKQVLGVEHVFVSRLSGGVFGAPQQVDPGLATASSQPVIAAGDGGLLLIAFVSGGALYAVDRAGSSAAYTTPIALAAGAANPAISISNFGKAYLAFTAGGAGGHDVRAAYYRGGSWAVESAPLDANPADDAGTGSGRPAVAAAGDGVGVVAWGEAGHVYTRRVWGTSPSIAFEQADVGSYSGWSEVAADQPAVGTGGDSSYCTVAFREQLSSGEAQQSRVLVRRLRGSQYEAVAAADGLSTPGADSAEQPQVAIDEYGQGLVTAERTGSHALFSMQVLGNGAPGPVNRLDSATNSGSPDAAAAVAGYHDGLIAWQQDPGSAGPPEIRIRFFDGSVFGPELIASSPALGPAAAAGAGGLSAAGDIAADVAAAWVQGSGSSARIVSAQLYQPPGGFHAQQRFHYVRSARPTLSWSTPHELWPPLGYSVVIDGSTAAQTTATQIAPQLADGPHSWSVVAVNRGGLTSTMATARLWVDTVAPAASLTIAGKLRAGSAVRVAVSYTDAPAPVQAADASGIAEVRVSWGDGSSAVIRHRAEHVYARPGRYGVKLTVTDRAGNATVVRRSIAIRPKARPKQRPKRGHR